MADVAEEGLRHALKAERSIAPKSNVRAAWEAILKDARDCTRCDLYKFATQTVFGEGPLDASIVFVGEQPGDLSSAPPERCSTTLSKRPESTAQPSMSPMR